MNKYIFFYSSVLTHKILRSSVITYKEYINSLSQFLMKFLPCIPKIVIIWSLAIISDCS